MIAYLRLVVIVSIIALQTISPCAAQEFLHLVHTQSGPVTGTRLPVNGIYAFKGIPFAAAPVGSLRWKAPQPVQPWTTPRNCNAFGPSPVQNKPVPFSMWSQEFLIPESPIDEDCLYLNVWSGAKKAGENRPVIVWIYGGGFSSGGSGVPIYDGEAMAKKGIVFVSINYRVGIFGFFAHPELTKESGVNASGNYGLMDQIAALKWVQANIAAFGGNPSNVSIAGQSAGSMSVNCLVASPLAKNLFKRAIAESGASLLSMGGRSIANLQQAEADGLKIAQTFNVTTIDQMRSLSAETLLKKAQGMSRPIVDGYVLPQSLAEIFAAGKENKVDLLTGWNENEGLMFGPIKTAAQFIADAKASYGDAASQFLKYYPASNDAEANTSQLNLSRDQIFGAQNYSWANIEAGRKNQVYVYRFLRKVPATGEYIKYGAFHTGEVPYAYGNLKFVNRPWESVDKELANHMLTYWANFAATGNPNGKGLPVWPAYKLIDKKIMLLDKQQHAATIPDAASLDFIVERMK